MIDVLVTFINLFSFVFTGLLLGRVIMSWIFPDPGTNFLSRWLYELTEPILIPVRRMLPQTGMIDLAPLVTFFLLQGLVWLANSLLFRI